MRQGWLCGSLWGRCLSIQDGSHIAAVDEVVLVLNLPCVSMRGCLVDTHTVVRRRGRGRASTSSARHHHYSGYSTYVPVPSQCRSGAWHARGVSLPAAVPTWRCPAPRAARRAAWGGGSAAAAPPWRDDAPRARRERRPRAVGGKRARCVHAPTRWAVAWAGSVSVSAVACCFTAAATYCTAPRRRAGEEVRGRVWGG